MRTMTLILAVLALFCFARSGCSKNHPTPQVAYTTPEDGEVNVATDVEITIAFSTPMDKESAENVFSMNPPVNGIFSWNGDDEMVFTPAAPLDPNTKYEVNMVAGAMSDKAVPMGFHTFEFTTGN